MRSKTPEDQVVHSVGSPVVLVVDDERGTDDEFVAGLAAEGFCVMLASSGEEGLSLLKSLRPDAVLVGSDLPDLSSHAMLRLLHEMEVTPVIAMSSTDDADENENEAVLAFELGAVDFLSHPRRVRESAVRIWAALRSLPATRPVIPQGSDRPDAQTRYVVAAGPVEVDLRRREIRVRGRWAHARPKEIELLWLLVSEAGSVVTRERAFEALWPGSGPKMAATLDVHIGRLRSLVEEEPSHPRHIVTVRGYGHRFDP